MPGAGNSQAYNRYSYNFNNPIRYIDPTGHYPACIGENADAGPQCYSEAKYIRARQSHLNWIYRTYSGAGTVWDKLPKTIQFSLESYGDSKNGYNETITGGATDTVEEGAKLAQDVVTALNDSLDWIETATGIEIPTVYGVGLAITRQLGEDKDRTDLTPKQKIARAGLVASEEYMVGTLAKSAGEALALDMAVALLRYEPQASNRALLPLVGGAYVVGYVGVTTVGSVVSEVFNQLVAFPLINYYVD